MVNILELLETLTALRDAGITEVACKSIVSDADCAVFVDTDEETDGPVLWVDFPR